MTDPAGPCDGRWRETGRVATRRLLIVLMNADPRNVAELRAPFYHAAVAAAMDYEVDVLCTAAAGRLMHKGVAESLLVKPGDPKTVYDWIKEAHEHGALLGLPGQSIFCVLTHDGLRKSA